jgi:predicted ATPase
MIEGFRICGFNILEDIVVGRFHNIDVAHLIENDPLSHVTAITGHVGSGKSTMIDAFLFLQDCFKHDVEYACDSRGLFRNATDASKLSPIQFDICCREKPYSPLFRYYLNIGLDCYHRPFVAEKTYGVVGEGLHEQTLHLRIENGEGFIGESIPEDAGIKDIREHEHEHEKCSKVSLRSNRKLGLSVCGAIERYSFLHSFFDSIGNWRFPKFDIKEMRRLSLLREQRHISSNGDNIANVAHYMETQHPNLFNQIVARVTLKNPEIKNVTVEIAPDGMGLLKFCGKYDSFYAQRISDGTLKWLAYLLLLYDPEPASLICIDDSLGMLSEVKDYRNAQIFLTVPLWDTIRLWASVDDGLIVSTCPFN